MKLRCEQLLTPTGWLSDKVITVANGVIERVAPANDNDKDYVLVKGRTVPGFIDIQVNGGGGVLFNQSPDVAGLVAIAEAHQQYGSTGIMPTLITDSLTIMQQAAQAVREARQQCPSILGIHFEGPWLSAARKGVHSAEYIRQAQPEELALLCDSSLGKVMVTVAPETVSPAQISLLCEAGVIVFLGHSDATAEQVLPALAAGASGFTHLYNAMSPLASRAPGMVGCALASEQSYAGLIVDGYHVDALACHVAVRAKGPAKICLVTDAMALAGSQATSMPFFNTTITRQNNKLTTSDGTLAGSCLTMIEAVKNTVKHCSVSLADAVTMASATPASVLGLQETLGAIAPGYQANLLTLDSHYDITHLWQQGSPVAIN